MVLPLIGVAIAAVSATAAAFTTHAVGAKDRESTKYHRDVNNELNNQYSDLQRKYTELQDEATKHIDELTRQRLESEAEKDLLRLGLRLQQYVCDLMFQIDDSPSYDLLKAFQESVSATNQVLFELQETLISVPPNYFSKYLMHTSENLAQEQIDLLLKGEIYPIQICPKCHQKNRITPHFSGNSPICGSCQTQLIKKVPTQKASPKTQAEIPQSSNRLYVCEDLGNGIELEMLRVPSGSFLLGSPEGMGCSNEYPQQKIDIPEFYLSRFPITQIQWQTVISCSRKNKEIKKLSLSFTKKPSKFRGSHQPVEQVSWYECQRFTQLLKQMTLRNYRLPSEVEWEYACKANKIQQNSTKKINHKYEHIWCKNNSDQKTQNVGLKESNVWGFSDMLGNIWEWCADDYVRTYHTKRTHHPFRQARSSTKVLRGGSWNSMPEVCRATSRIGYAPDSQNSCFGFRLALSSVDAR
ncbi:formylglycine-generating enzyme family protein [[Limnothrix rosea] IAM M-220]|uniref:formylglycine-generating enzyme family protein n=1 Tax=[Limnothrix rosea] IAM M-220 TaxID=454133 RepID=UPI0009652EE9|nr:formylglycine-generating enzyme family protein [[Limnothrix rosea] IAM M-220]OKH18010.1 hypothetical protein NIES208_07535 [[Limnothrix rosea] IAM M-220]